MELRRYRIRITEGGMKTCQFSILRFLDEKIHRATERLQNTEMQLGNAHDEMKRQSERMQS